VSYNYPEVGIIDTWRIRELLTPHPGIVWLVETIESTPMSNYREAYLWLLAAQIPVLKKLVSAVFTSIEDKLMV